MSQLLKKLKLLFKALFLIAFVSITILAFIPSYENLPEVVSVSDLLNHTLAFFLLFLLLRVAAFTESVKKEIIFLFSYALFIEFVQYFLPTRAAEYLDVLADMSGVLIATSLYYLLKFLFTRKN